MEGYRPTRQADLIYEIRALGAAGAVLHLGAHPDDEDIGLLAYAYRKFGARAAYWSATRGEGGQNRIGPYAQDALGIYRTWESMAARQDDGGECLFGPFYDFGFSKTAEEAIDKWGWDNLVREMVRTIRMVQPAVVVGRWQGNAGDFHGHHQAVGRASLEAFEAAGDADRFPELGAQGLPVWEARRFFYSLDNTGGDQTAGGAANIFGRPNPTLEKSWSVEIDGQLLDVVRLNTGEFDPLSGGTYQQRAWVAYNRHQTQAMGLVPNPGDFFYYFALHSDRVPVPGRPRTIYDHLDPTITGLACYPGTGSAFLEGRLQAICAKSEQAASAYAAEDPRASGLLLLDLLGLLRQTTDTLSKARLGKERARTLKYFLTRRSREVERIAARLLGLELECLSDRSSVIPGDGAQATVRLWNHAALEVSAPKLRVELPKGWKATRRRATPATDGGRATDSHTPLLEQRFRIAVPKGAKLTCPYWLKKPRKTFLYEWPEDGSGGVPFAPPPVRIHCELEAEGTALSLEAFAVRREAFPGGFRELPLSTIAPISIANRARRKFLQYQRSGQELTLVANVRNNTDHAVRGSLEVKVPAGWSVTPEPCTFRLAKPGDSKTFNHAVTVAPRAKKGRYRIAYKVTCKDRVYDSTVLPVYMTPPGIPGPANEANCIKQALILSPAEVRVHIIDARFIPTLSYAYIDGAKEGVREALQPFGIEFEVLSDQDLSYRDLSTFDCIVVGPNAYLVRQELKKNAARLLDYVAAGGTLIVQFQGYAYQTPGLAPYPFGYSQPHDRVTLERAPIEFLEPDHLLFRIPNKITGKDFHDWTSDRGMYFFAEHGRDDRYQALLASADDDRPLSGGLLECQYGRGTYVYCGYSLFKQLPIGNPGAFRLFANLLSLPEARIIERIEFLKQVPLFSTLDREQLDPMARIMTERWVESGTYICRAGEVSQELFIVYRGAVEVVQEADGKSKVLYVATAGSCVGELAVLRDKPRLADLRCQVNTEILVIKGDYFISVLRGYPEVGVRLIKLLVDRLHP